MTSKTLALPGPAMQMKVRLVAACTLSALADADMGIRSQLTSGAIVDADTLARRIATAREMLQLAEDALASLA